MSGMDFFTEEEVEEIIYAAGHIAAGVDESATADPHAADSLDLGFELLAKLVQFREHVASSEALYDEYAKGFAAGWDRGRRPTMAIPRPGTSVIF